jgi:DNA-directed RNA polymerase specialized sigma24 family protein
MTDVSVSILLSQLKAGATPDAAQAIWTRYFDRLARMARQRLTERTRRLADEEDVALSAFDSFFRGVADGRFPQLNDRDDLWQVLVLLTERKAIDRIRRATADKRGGGAVRGDSVFDRSKDLDSGAGMEQLAGSEPSPELAAMFEDECRRFLNLLNAPELAQLALWKLEGLTNEEIANKLGRVVRSVQRKLKTIRRIWEQAAEQSA